MTLTEVAEKAFEIIDSHAVVKVADASFDGGEFSGPTHAEVEAREIEQLAKANGFTADDVWTEMHRLSNCLEGS